MPISPQLQKSLNDDRAAYLMQLLDSKAGVIPGAYFTMQELNVIRNKAHAELAALLRRDFLAHREPVAAGGLPPRG